MVIEVQKGPTGRIKGLRGLLNGLRREDVLGVLPQFTLEATARHGFADSTDYDLVHEGKHYPPKAILGIAAERIVGRPLTSDEFTGGDTSTCFAILESLNFKIVQKQEKQGGPDEVSNVLASLRPTTETMVMDLVRDAGVDVRPWAVKKGGATVVTPQANPAYCYEWSFGGGAEPTVLCVWHRNIKVAGGSICYEDNLREFANQLDVVATKKANPSDVISRARSQAVRARKFDLAIQRAAFAKHSLRIIILIGEDSGGENIGWDTAKGRYRSLDEEPWTIEHYVIDTGQFRLIRGYHAAKVVEDVTPVESAPSFVDQFSIPVPAERLEVLTAALPRSAEIRRKVLERAQGTCECCGEIGFRMVNGSIYLETHHVIPLGNGGPDVEWNVVAICPNDHRRTHFAVERDDLRDQLIATLSMTFPKAHDALQSLRASSAERSSV
jgi:5-methylcytosine-specific restriction protein A